MRRPLAFLPAALLVAPAGGSAPAPACPVSGPPYPSAPLAAAGGSLWVACPGRGELVRLDAWRRARA